MTSKLTRSLMGASALLALAMAGGSASAITINGVATVGTVVYGGGSTLIAPYARQAGDCYATPVPLINKGSNAASPSFATFTGFNYTGTPAQNCATTHTVSTMTLVYAGVGSGGAQQAYFDHDASKGGSTYDGTNYFPAWHYSASDAGLGSSDVDVYNNGGATLGAVTTGSKAVNVAGSANPGGTYPNPKDTYGAMIQVPGLVAPVTIAFSPVYKKVADASGNITTYSFNPYYKVGGVAVIRLDQDTYCKIFNGQITNWNDPAISKLNSKKVMVKGVATYATIKDPTDPTADASWSVPIELVGRSDSSGTTSIWTRHLARVCGDNTIVTAATASANLYANGALTLPAGLQGPSYNKTQANTTVTPVSGKYTIANGSDGVAKYLAFTQVPANSSSATQGRIGYLGPDYTSAGGNSSYGLIVAALLNSGAPTPAYVLPTAKSAAASFGTVLPPQSDATGAYVAGTTGNGLRTDPSAWVQTPDKGQSLAYITGKANAYPIVGTTNFLLYSCYADATSGSASNVGYQLNQFLSWYYNNKIVTSTTAGSLGILTTNGFSAMPAAWRTAITKTFIKPDTTATSTNTSSLKLWVSSKSDVPGATAKAKPVFTHNSSCDAVTGA